MAQDDVYHYFIDVSTGSSARKGTCAEWIQDDDIDYGHNIDVSTRN